MASLGVETKRGLWALRYLLGRTETDRRVAGIVLAGGTVPGEQSLLFFLEVEFSFCFRIPENVSATP